MLVQHASIAVSCHVKTSLVLTRLSEACLPALPARQLPIHARQPSYEQRHARATRRATRPDIRRLGSWVSVVLASGRASGQVDGRTGRARSVCAATAAGRDGRAMRVVSHGAAVSGQGRGRGVRQMCPCRHVRRWARVWKQTRVMLGGRRPLRHRRRRHESQQAHRRCTSNLGAQNGRYCSSAFATTPRGRVS